jgi:hypothetical protein
MNGPLGKEFSGEVPQRRGSRVHLTPAARSSFIPAPFFPIPWLPSLPALPRAYQIPRRLSGQTTQFQMVGTAPAISWTTYGVPWKYDASHYSVGAKFYFEVYLWSAFDDSPAWARLIDFDGGNEAGGSFVGTSVVDDKLIRSGEVGLVDGHRYVAQFASAAGANAQGAHIIVV